MLVIVLSGTFDAPLVNRAYRLGADSFLTKPCIPDEIKNPIEYFPEYWTVGEKNEKGASA